MDWGARLNQKVRPHATASPLHLWPKILTGKVETSVNAPDLVDPSLTAGLMCLVRTAAISACLANPETTD
jgi:hypothetical protein